LNCLPIIILLYSCYYIVLWYYRRLFEPIASENQLKISEDIQELNLQRCMQQGQLQQCYWIPENASKQSSVAAINISTCRFYQEEVIFILHHRAYHLLWELYKRFSRQHQSPTQKDSKNRLFPQAHIIKHQNSSTRKDFQCVSHIL
jgi:hypothetical protein